MTATKSAAHRIGLVPCGSCNAAGLPADQVHVPCPWCWNAGLNCHTRFVPVDKAIEWAKEHGMDMHDIPTPAEQRGALEKVPDTLPAPKAEEPK